MHACMLHEKPPNKKIYCRCPFVHRSFGYLVCFSFIVGRGKTMEVGCVGCEKGGEGGALVAWQPPFWAALRLKAEKMCEKSSGDYWFRTRRYLCLLLSQMSLEREKGYNQKKTSLTINRCG